MRSCLDYALVMFKLVDDGRGWIAAMGDPVDA